MNLPSLKEISKKAISALERFPITLLWAFLGSIYCIYFIEQDKGDFFKNHSNIVLTLILGVSWLIGIQFLIEQLENPKKWQWTKLVVLGLLFFFYWHMPKLVGFNDDPTYYTRFFLYFVSGHLFILFAPFIRKWDTNAHWNYIKSVSFSIGRSLLFSGVLYLGLVLALLAIDSLFNVDLESRRYGQLFVFCLGTINTWIYLSDFPKKVLKHTFIQFNRALEVFVQYILIPLVLLYLGILYVYSLKILIQWELPKGWVSYLVIALSILGFAIQHIIDPVQKTLRSWAINKFYPWFYILLLPLVLLLFVAIFRRIGDYGITENRYFVLLLAFWILGTILCLLSSKKKQLKTMSISLFILTLLSSFGFWGAFSISQDSQVKQFKEVYQTVIESNKLASDAQYGQLKSIIRYLADRKTISKLDPVVGISTHTIGLDTLENSETPYYHYNIPQLLLDSLAIKLDAKIDIDHNNNFYHLYQNRANTHNYLIGDFEYVALLNFDDYQDNKMEIGELKATFDDKQVHFIFTDPKSKDTVMTIPFQNKLRELTRHGNNLNDLSNEELSLTSQSEKYQAKLIFTELSYYIEEKSIYLSSGQVFIFLKQN